MLRFLRYLAILVVVLLAIMGALNVFSDLMVETNIAGSRSPGVVMPYSDFLREADAGRIGSIIVQGSELRGRLADGKPFNTYLPPNQGQLLALVRDRQISAIWAPADSPPKFMNLVLGWLPFLLMLFILRYAGVRVRGSVEAVQPLRRTIADLERRLALIEGAPGAPAHEP